MAEIYALHCPITNEVRYIGKSNNSAKRFEQHLREKRRKYPLYCWINSLQAKGLSPYYSILLTTDNWEFEERRLITEYRQSGVKLLNIADGGEEPKCSKETRQANGRKVSAAIQADPQRKRLHDLKKIFAIGVKFLSEEKKAEMYEKAKQELVIAEAKYKELLQWRNTLKNNRQLSLMN